MRAEDLATKTAGTFTVGTDNPAFPPYFSEPEEGETATDPWEFGDPTNGRGFESAVAYALAEQLGFSEDQVTWIPVPFNNAIAPGPKDFDVYLAQVSFTEERTQAVDLSEGYFFSNQALVTADSPLADADHLRGRRALLGAAGNTTSLTYITEHPADAGADGLRRQHRREGGPRGRPDRRRRLRPATAFYIVNVEMENGVVVGQFPSDPDDKEHFSFVLDLDSPLTDCVNEAILTMGENGAGLDRRGVAVRLPRRAPDHRVAAAGLDRPARPDLPLSRRRRRAGGGALRTGGGAARRRALDRSCSSRSIGVIVVNAPGWEREGAFFDWDNFAESAPDIVAKFWVNVGSSSSPRS